MALIFADPVNDPKLAREIYDKNSLEQIRLYNFGSLLNLGTRLDALYPLPHVMALLREANFGEGDDELTLKFDLAYFQQLMNDTNTFKALMTFMAETQEDKDVVVICNYNERNFQPVVESLMKMVQERYGISAYVVNVLEDLEAIDRTTGLTDNEKEKLVNFITDCGRFAQITGNPIITAKQMETEIASVNLDTEAILENAKDELEQKLNQPN